MSTLISEASPDQTGRKYIMLGEITYQRADGSKGRRPLLYISDFEACLILEDSTHMRKLNLNKLKKLVGEADLPVLSASVD